MEVDIEIPSVEGIRAEAATIVRWLKREGEWVEKDEPVLLVEFPKASVEISAPASGTLSRIITGEGRMARVGDRVGSLQT